MQLEYGQTVLFKIGDIKMAESAQIRENDGSLNNVIASEQTVKPIEPLIQRVN